MVNCVCMSCIFYSTACSPEGYGSGLPLPLRTARPFSRLYYTQRSRSRPQRHVRYTGATRSPSPHGHRTKEKKKPHAHQEKKEKKGPDPSTPTPLSPFPPPPGLALPPPASRPPCRPPPPPPERPGSHLREPPGPRPLSLDVGGGGDLHPLAAIQHPKVDLGGARWDSAYTGAHADGLSK